MSGKKHKYASLEAGAGTENQPKRKIPCYQESYTIAGPSTDIPIATTMPPVYPLAQPSRPVLPKPAITSSGDNAPIPPGAHVVGSQAPQARQLSQGPGFTPHNLQASTSAPDPIQPSPSFPPSTAIQDDMDIATVFTHSSNTDTVTQNQATSLDFLSQIYPHIPTMWGYCSSCDNLWRSHRESMMGLLRTQGVGINIAGNGLDSIPVTCNIFRSFFDFQDHAERYHGWRLG